MPEFNKLWLQQRLNGLAVNVAMQAIQATGQALPCSVIEVNPEGFGYGFVKVNFEVQSSTDQPLNLYPVIIPKAESQWLRSPTQVGDYGMTVPADAFLGGVSGQGSGVAQIGPGTDTGNLSDLIWVPIACTSFPTTPNPNQAWVNGPDGAVVSDTAQTGVVTCQHDAVLLQTDSTATGNGVVRQSDLETAFANYHHFLVTTYFPANLNSTASGAGWTQTTPETLPTPDASTKTFSG